MQTGVHVIAVIEPNMLPAPIKMNMANGPGGKGRGGRGGWGTLGPFEWGCAARSLEHGGSFSKS